jgi:hypothetical protein
MVTGLLQSSGAQAAHVHHTATSCTCNEHGPQEEQGAAEFTSCNLIRRCLPACSSSEQRHKQAKQAEQNAIHAQAIAEAQFGALLEEQGARLAGEDVDGAVYELRFRFWTNNQSRMYLIEGCAELLKKYKLGFGDVIVFARKADGTLVLGGRPAGPVRFTHAFADVSVFARKADGALALGGRPAGVERVGRIQYRFLSVAVGSAHCSWHRVESRFGSSAGCMPAMWQLICARGRLRAERGVTGHESRIAQSCGRASGDAGSRAGGQHEAVCIALVYCH